MKNQTFLFSDTSDPEDATTEARASTATNTTLRLGVGKDSRLSPMQQRFNRLLARIEKLKGQIADLQTLADAYRPQYSSTLTPLQERMQALMRGMVLKLDERMQGKGLSAAQKRIGAEILCGLSEGLAATGDETMQALHDKYSPRSLREKEQDGVADMRDMMEDIFGQPLKSDESLDSFEAMMKAVAQQLQEASQAEQTRRETKRARKKPTAAQLKAVQQQEDAETVLRKVFRQLASALHPDRERDPVERQRKTVLMSEANVAYERQDLVAMLQIQMRIEQTDSQSLAQLAEEKIEAMSLLLKQQATELERDLYEHKQQVLQEFHLSPYDVPSVACLRTQLLVRESTLKRDLAIMEQDFLEVQDDAGLKRWLKSQKQMAQEDERAQARSFF